MKKEKEFNDILDKCLERIIRGETVEQCLTSYPEYAAELGPLLRTATVVQKAAAIEPRSEFKAKARYQFRTAIAGLGAKPSHRFFVWQPRWAMAVVTVIILLVSGTGTMAAASNSMPDQPLYPLKLAAETARLRLTPSHLAKAELYANLADKRVKEIVVMTSRGKPEEVERTVERLNDYLEKLASLNTPQREPVKMFPAAAPPVVSPARLKEEERAKLKKIIGRHAADNPETLRTLLKKVPPSMKPALVRAIEVADNGYKRALEKLD